MTVLPHMSAVSKRLPHPFKTSWTLSCWFVAKSNRSRDNSLHLRIPPTDISMATWLKGRADYAKLIEKYDTFLFDCDGVLWIEEHVIPGAAEVLGYLRSRRKLDNSDVTKAAALMPL
jgi:hypothetical protein